MERDLAGFEALVRARRSVRAFLPQPVEPALIERVIGIAAGAPSSCNTQPWKLHVVSGAALARLRIALEEAVAEGVPAAPDLPAAMPYRGLYRDRQVDAAARLFEAQGVARSDLAGRRASMLRNYAFFGAPHVALLFMPADGGVHEAADCGKFAQTFMLALAAAGIGSCPQGSLSFYPDVVRRVLGLAAPGRLLLGISFGRADEDDPTAAVRPSRIPLTEVAEFH